MHGYIWALFLKINSVGFDLVALQASSKLDLEKAGPEVFLKFVYRDQISDETVDAINVLRRKVGRHNVTEKRSVAN